MSALYGEISQWLQKGRAPKVRELVRQAIDEGCPAQEILKEGLMAGMNVVGEKFKNNEVFVPEVLVAARAMKMGAEELKPYLGGQTQASGTVVLGTVQGDLHDIGKNLVRIMLEGRGLEVVDLGVDVSPQQFYDAAVAHHADAVCLSALLTTTMGVMRQTVELFNQTGLHDTVKIMIGGAPVTQQYCDEIGADIYTSDAASAAQAAAELCACKAG